MSVQSNSLTNGQVTEAIAKIISEIGGVQKDGTNTHQNYKYATISDVLEKVQPKLGENGLVVFQHELDRNVICDGAVMAIKYEFSVAKGGHVVGPFHQTGLSSFATRNGWDDKAGNKCHTAARKYFLLALFQMPTNDAEDADGGGDAPAIPAKPAAKTPPVHKIEIEPPIDPVTGELSPHKIAMDGMSAVDWGGLFAAGVNSSKNLKEVSDWIFDNQHTIEAIRKDLPRLAVRIDQICDDKAKEFAVKAIVDAGASGNILEALDHQMGLMKTTRQVEQVWKNNEAVINALDGADKTAADALLLHHQNRVSMKKAA